jgi:hypothetical protein
VRQPAVIFDRDGTLFQIEREFVECDKPDWASFNAALVFDNPVERIVALTHALRPDIKVLITSGRSEEFRPQMIASLTKHRVNYDRVFMRHLRDQRRDDVVKRELFLNEISPHYDVLFVVDDRPIVCDMWREIGLPLLQVTQPDDVPVFRFLGGSDGGLGSD